MMIFLALGVHDTVAWLDRQNKFVNSIKNDTRVDVKSENRKVLPAMTPGPHTELKKIVTMAKNKL